MAISALLAEWFKGKELAFAFGVNLSISRVGSVINNIVSPTVADKYNMSSVCWIGVGMCIFSVLSVLIANPIDAAFDMPNGHNSYHPLFNISASEETHLLLLPSTTNNNNTNTTYCNTNTPAAAASEGAVLHADTIVLLQEAHLKGHNSDPSPSSPPLHQLLLEIYALPSIFWVLILLTCCIYGAVIPFNNIASSLLLERDYFKQPPDVCTLTIPYSCQSPSNPPNFNTCPVYDSSGEIHYTLLVILYKYIYLTYIYLTCIYILYLMYIHYIGSNKNSYRPPLPSHITIHGVYYTQLQPSDIDCTNKHWQHGCTEIYCNYLSYAEKQAAIIMSIPYLISILLSPILGLGIDFFGHRADINTLSCVLLICVHVLLAYSDIDAVVPLVGQGLVYSGFAAVSIVYIVYVYYCVNIDCIVYTNACINIRVVYVGFYVLVKLQPLLSYIYT